MLSEIAMTHRREFDDALRLTGGHYAALKPSS